MLQIMTSHFRRRGDGGIMKMGGEGGICVSNTWGFAKIRGTILGVPIIRTIIFWGLYWGPPI